MLTAPAQSTAVPASADDRETACRGQTAHLVEKGFRPSTSVGRSDVSARARSMLKTTSAAVNGVSS